MSKFPPNDKSFLTYKGSETVSVCKITSFAQNFLGKVLVTDDLGPTLASRNSLCNTNPEHLCSQLQIILEIFKICSYNFQLRDSHFLHAVALAFFFLGFVSVCSCSLQAFGNYFIYAAALLEIFRINFS